MLLLEIVLLLEIMLLPDRTMPLRRRNIPPR